MHVPRRRRPPALRTAAATLAILGGGGLLAPLPATAQGGAGPPSASEPLGGRLVRDTVHAAALEGNALGDAIRREVLVYLPPGYVERADERFPVLYLLHNYFGDNDQWVDGTFGGFDLRSAMDSLVAAGAVRPMIVAMPDARSGLVGSPYLSSGLTGDWEGFIRSDVVAHVDRRYRTSPVPRARGIAGHSAGGYAALKLAIKHPEVFSVVYGLSPCCLAPGASEWGGEALLLLALAASEEGFSCEDGGWASQVPALLVHLCPDRLRRLRAIRFDVGDDDPFERALPAADAFSRLLGERGIEHRFERYRGDHSGGVGRRMAAEVLPFFSRRLSADDALSRAGPEASRSRE